MESPIPGMLVAGVADGHGGTFVSDIIKMEIGGLVKKLFADIRLILLYHSYIRYNIYGQIEGVYVRESDSFISRYG